MKNAAKEANQNWKFAQNCRSLILLVERICGGVVSWLERQNVWIQDEQTGKERKEGVCPIEWSSLNARSSAFK